MKILLKNPKILALIAAMIFGGGGYYYVAQKQSSVQNTNNTNDQTKPQTKTDIYQNNNAGQNNSSQSNTNTNGQNTPTGNQISAEEQAARDVVAAFENAYKTKDKIGIFKNFTDPITQQDKDTKNRLINGVDTAGNLGGPTLFETNTASEYPDSYQVTNAQKTSSGYTITVQENRKTDSGSASSKIRTIKLVKSGSGWFIDSYENDYSGKYTGFLL